MCLYVGTHVWMWGACGYQKKTSDLLELLIMNHSVWVLGTERWSSTGTINHRAISRVLLIHIFTAASRTLGTMWAGVGRKEVLNLLPVWGAKSSISSCVLVLNVRCKLFIRWKTVMFFLLPEIFHLSGKTSSLKTQIVLLTFAFHFIRFQVVLIYSYWFYVLVS